MGSSSSTMSRSKGNSAIVSLQTQDSSNAKDDNSCHSQSSVSEPKSRVTALVPPPVPPPLPRHETASDAPPLPPSSSTQSSKPASDSKDESTFSQSIVKKLLPLDEWKNRFKKLKVQEHDLQFILKIINNSQETLANILETCYQCVAHMKSKDKNIIPLETLNSEFFTLETDEREIIGDFLVYLNFPSESLAQYKSALSKINVEHFDDTNESLVKKLDDYLKSLIYLVRSHWWNFSDASSQFCVGLATHGIVKEMVDDLQSMVSSEDLLLKYSFSFESAIGVLHNVSKLNSQRQLYRDLKVVDILGQFLEKSDLPKVTMLVLLTLSNIIDENQTDLLFAHGASFDLVLHLAKMAWKSSEHRYDGFSLEELLQGMLGLSRNDKVKRLLVEKGVLKLLDSILNQSKEKEQQVAVKLLWELAFDPENKEKIKENKSLMTAVKSLSSSKSGKISRSAQGVLWVLDIGKEKQDETTKARKKMHRSSTSSLTSEATSGKRALRHVMISYNWGDQKNLILVKDILRAHGYEIWIDIENIKGSTLQAMADAVERAAVVLICMSERYKESANCRAEAEYAFSLKKPIIPLLMQRAYKPDGWLGILLGTKLFFDFSGKYDLNTKCTELMKELGNLGNTSALHDEVDSVDGPIIKEIVPAVSKAPKPTVKKLDVSEWMSENDLKKITCLNDLKPEHLFFLKRMSTRAPEQYYKITMDFLQGKMTAENLDTLMKVTQAIEKLPHI